MSIQKPLRILISPLDWGLGHTTRCVPLISYIRHQGHSVVFAGNEWQRKYIVETFADIETIDLNGYNVYYSKSATGFMFSLFKQLPGLLKTITEEHNWLLETVVKYKVDGIISDNRYGLYHTDIPSVIMTHQVLAQTGLSNIPDRLLRSLHYKRLERFGNCWIIDVAGKPNLGGKLSHPAILPANAKYLGMLSQIETAQTSEEQLMILLSGPEPQRTILSDILWEQIQHYTGKIVFVEGSNIAVRNNAPPHIDYYTRITKETLQPLLQKASMVICRSGYSTLMDLAVLKKKAILIPTPGQTEQEYLGIHLHKEGVFYRAPQKGFNLEKVLKETAAFPFKHLQLDGGFYEYKTVLDKWLKNIG